MPVNRGQGRTTRWYQLCFVPTSPDSSDDSDIESVVLTPSSTWQESSPPSPPISEPEIDWDIPLLPPPPPPNLEPEIDSRFPSLLPPTPLPNFLLSSPQQSTWVRTLDIEVQEDRLQPPSPSPSHVFEGDQSDCSINPMIGISRLRVSETDKLFHCPICMDEFKVGDDKEYQLPCTHTYCSECILRWLNNSKTCPVCRLQLNNCSFDSINDNNGLDSPPDSPHSPLRSPRLGDYFFESPPYLISGIDNSINDNNGLDAQPEILPPNPHLLRHWGSFSESRLYLSEQDIENSAGGNSDEADYDSACDELNDPHEDGASQSAPAQLT